jgi:hypothetical protein
MELGAAPIILHPARGMTGHGSRFVEAMMPMQYDPRREMPMRRTTMLATTLLALFGAHITAPRNFTPIPVAHGCRPDDRCLRECESQHRQDCYGACSRARPGCR